jgi:hypothetical protein
MSTTRRTILAAVAAFVAGMVRPAKADDVFFAPAPVLGSIPGSPVFCVYEQSNGETTWITWVDGQEVERITWDRDGKRGTGETP